MPKSREKCMKTSAYLQQDSHGFSIHVSTFPVNIVDVNCPKKTLPKVVPTPDLQVRRHVGLHAFPLALQPAVVRLTGAAPVAPQASADHVLPSRGGHRGRGLQHGTPGHGACNIFTSVSAVKKSVCYFPLLKFATVFSFLFKSVCSSSNSHSTALQVRSAPGMWRGVLRHLPSFGAEPLRIIAAAAHAMPAQADATCSVFGGSRPCQVFG